MTAIPSYIRLIRVGLGCAAGLAPSGGCTEPVFDAQARDAETLLKPEAGDGDSKDAGLIKSDAATLRDAGVPPIDLPKRDAAPVDQTPVSGGDAGAQPRDAGDVGPPLVFTDDGGAAQCALTGMYSVRGQMTVGWDGKTLAGIYPLVRKGTGSAEVFARVDLYAQQAIMPSRVSICGTTLPQFAAGDATFVNEQYGFYIPDEVWDGADVPRWDLVWERSCAALGPGCEFSSKPLSATIGAAAFVEAPAMLMTEDHDGDGNPGLTVKALTPAQTSNMGLPFTFIPISYSTPARTETVFAALLVNATFNAKLTDCDSFSGTLSEPRIAIRAAGCLVHNTENSPEVPCSTEQLRFLADNVPTIKVQTATFEGRRISNEADCAAVRSVWGVKPTPR